MINNKYLGLTALEYLFNLIKSNFVNKKYSTTYSGYYLSVNKDGNVSLDTLPITTFAYDSENNALKLITRHNGSLTLDNVSLLDNTRIY